MKRVAVVLIVVMAVALSAGCAKRQQPLVESSEVKFQDYKAYAHHGESSADAQYVRFRRASGAEEFQLVLPRHLPRLVVSYEANIKAGKLIFKVINPNGKAIIGGTTDAKGHLKLYHSLRVPAGTYTVRTEYRNAENGDIRYTMYGYYK